MTLYGLDDVEQFNRQAPISLRRLGVDVPAAAGIDPMERLVELLDLLDAWVLAQRLWVTEGGVAATLPTMHTQLRHELDRLRPDVPGAGLRSAADRVHQALALLNGTEDQVLQLLLVAACRIITARLMTPDEAAQPEVAGYDNGPVYAPAGTQLLRDASVLLAEAGHHLVREGGKS